MRNSDLSQNAVEVLCTRSRSSKQTCLTLYSATKFTIALGYCYGIRSERRLCEEVELHLAYRWFTVSAMAPMVSSTGAPRARHQTGLWVDNMAMAMSVVASTRGLALMPAYAKNLLPRSVVSRPLEGEAPTIDLVVGYSKANTSPILTPFLSRIDDLTARTSSKVRRMSGPGSPAAPR